MRIEDKRNKDIPLCEVKSGKVFRFGTKFYMKTNKWGMEIGTYLCIDLYEGEAVYMDSMQIVESIPDAKVVIE